MPGNFAELTHLMHTNLFFTIAVIFWVMVGALIILYLAGGLSGLWRLFQMRSIRRHSLDEQKRERNRRPRTRQS